MGKTSTSPVDVAADNRRSGPERIVAWVLGLGPVLQAACVMVIVGTLIRCWQAFGSNYAQDDFAWLLKARDEGLSWDFVMQPWNGHFQPGGWFLTWVCQLVPGYFLPAVFTVLFSLAASVGVVLLLHELVGARWPMLIGLAIYLFTPLTQANVMWWASMVITIPVHVSLAAAGVCHLRFMRTRNLAWLGGVLGALVFGFAFTEKTVMVPVFLGLLSILATDGGWRKAFQTVTGLWSTWVIYALVTIGYLFLYFHVVGSVTSYPIQSVRDYFDVVFQQIWAVFTFGILGGPWHSSYTSPAFGYINFTAFAQILVLQVVIAILILAWLRRGPRSLQAWGVLLVYLLVNISITATGRGQFTGLVVRETRYIADVVVITACVIAVVLTPLRPASAPPDRWMRRYPRAMTLVGVLALLNSSMYTLSQSVPDYHKVGSGPYVANVRAAMAKDPNLGLYDGHVPASIMVPFFETEATRVHVVLDAFDIHPRYNKPSAHMRILDESGNPWPIAVFFGSSAVIVSSNRACGLGLKAGDAGVMRLDKPVDATSRVMRVDYYTSEDAILKIGGTGQQHTFGLPSTETSIFVAVEGPIDRLDYQLLSGDGVVCVNGVDIGFPQPDLSVASGK